MWWCNEEVVVVVVVVVVVEVAVAVAVAVFVVVGVATLLPAAAAAAAAAALDFGVLPLGVLTPLPLLPPPMAAALPLSAAKRPPTLMSLRAGEKGCREGLPVARCIAAECRWPVPPPGTSPPLAKMLVRSCPGAKRAALVGAGVSLPPVPFLLGVHLRLYGVGKGEQPPRLPRLPVMSLPPPRPAFPGENSYMALQAELNWTVEGVGRA